MLLMEILSQDCSNIGTDNTAEIQVDLLCRENAR